MRGIRVYADTSVFGGTQDEEFSGASRRFFERVRTGEFIVVVSQVTIDELAAAPEAVQQVLKDLPDERIVQVSAGEEARALAQAYIDAGILSDSSMADAIHVATATVGRADVILSWNFNHIVNFDRIHKYNGVNALSGYPQIEIHSPLEMTGGREDQDI